MDKFTFYTEWGSLFDLLSDIDKGILIDAILHYCKTGEDLIESQGIESEPLKLAFKCISNAIMREQEHRHHISEMRSLSGRKSASLRKSKKQ